MKDPLEEINDLYRKFYEEYIDILEAIAFGVIQIPKLKKTSLSFFATHSFFYERITDFFVTSWRHFFILFLFLYINSIHSKNSFTEWESFILLTASAQNT